LELPIGKERKEIEDMDVKQGSFQKNATEFD
jgi:hypothetical protein